MNYLTKNYRVFLAFSLFVFLLNCVFQYASYEYYVIDPFASSLSIVLFRALAMTIFWLAGFAAAGLLYLHTKSRLFLFFWVGFFVSVIAIWTINIGVMYFSGFYLSPLVLSHTGGSGPVVWTPVTYILIAGFFAVFALFVLLFRYAIRTFKFVPSKKHLSRSCSLLLIVAVVFSLFNLSLFRNTPDFLIASSFYQNFGGEDEKLDELSPIVQAKLQEFGLFYDLDNFSVAHREKVFESSGERLLPDRFGDGRPNIFVVFFESLSSRLTDVYNPRFDGLTPGLAEMAEDPNTTVFKNYYNSSTPTITGLLSQLCSFLTPTGHEEIDEENMFGDHRFLCLPEVLKNDAQYDDVSYVISISKDFARTGTIFGSMGVDEIYDFDELMKYVPGKHLSWGYSDHQLFSFAWDFINERDGGPWMMMLSTLDVHAPFDLAEDMIEYEDGEDKVLNSVHTSDDAFREFWGKFTESELFEDTILIVTADHAIFPGVLSRESFPEEAGVLLPYDEVPLMMYIPDNILPKEVDTYSSALDLAPTILHLLDVNVPNSFEGRSIFDDRPDYPNLLGMHQLGLYINTAGKDGERVIDYDVPDYMTCDENFEVLERGLTLCEYLHFYKWKRQAWQDGRFWEK